VRLEDACREHRERARESGGEVGRLQARRGERSARLRELAVVAAELEALVVEAGEGLARAGEERGGAGGEQSGRAATGLDAASLTAVTGQITAARGALGRRNDLATRIATDEAALERVEAELAAAQGVAVEAERALAEHDALRRRESDAANAAA